MTPRVALATMTVLALLAPATARAQEERNFGITMGFPPSIGAFWQMSDRMALRPEFNFAAVMDDDDDESWNYGVGVTTLIYIGANAPLRMYAAPRFVYQRVGSEDPGNNLSFESSTNSYALSGLFGARYLLGDRFAVYGEAGVRVEYRSGTFQVTGAGFSSSSDSEQYGVGSTGGVGIVLLF
jgi:hypothetical protein